MGIEPEKEITISFLPENIIEGKYLSKGDERWVVVGEKLEGGNEIGKEDRLKVYAGMFQTAYLNASISEDEYLVVAYLRYLFEISDEENELVMNGIHDALEEHVEKNVFQVVEKGFDQAKDVVDGLFNRIRSILPEGGPKGDEK